MGKPKKSTAGPKAPVVKEKKEKPKAVGVGMTYLRSTYRREGKESGLSLKAWVDANATELLERCLDRLEGAFTCSHKAEKLLRSA